MKGRWSNETSKRNEQTSTGRWSADVEATRQRAQTEMSRPVQRDVAPAAQDTPQRNNVMSMAINSLRNRLANSTVGNATREWASRMSNTYQTIANETPVERARRQQARIDRAALIDQIPDNVSDARRQQWAIDNAQLMDQASSQYEGPVRTSLPVEVKSTSTLGINDSGLEDEYEYDSNGMPVRKRELPETTILTKKPAEANPNYVPLSNEERSQLIQDYYRANMGGAKGYDRDKVNYEVWKRGGIEQLQDEQQAAMGSDWRYAAAQRGNDVSNMSAAKRFLSAWGNFAMGVDDSISSAVAGTLAAGTYSGAIAGQTYWVNQGKKDAEELFRLYESPDKSEEMQEYIKQKEASLREAAVNLGGERYADEVMAYMADVANGITPGKVFATLDNDDVSLQIGYTKGEKDYFINQSDAGAFQQVAENLRDKATTELQRAKDVALLNEISPDATNLIVGAGSTAVESLVDAGIATALGLSGTGLAYIPFALRSFGGSYSEALSAMKAAGQEIGIDAINKATTYGAASAGIEVATEAMWTLGNFMGAVTKGSPLDDVATKKLTEALKGLPKTEAGKKALVKIGEYLMGGTTEGVEEWVGYTLNYLFNTAGIYSGEDRGEYDWKEVWDSFSAAALSTLISGGTQAAAHPAQQAALGRELKAGGITLSDGTKLTIDDMVNLANTPGMEGTTLEQTYSSLFNGMPRSTEFTDRELGQLYEAYEETMGRSEEGAERVQEILGKVENGEELKRSDVNRITNNPDAVRYLRSASGTELNLDGNITERKAAVEDALRAFASQNETLRNAMTENLSPNAENANTGDLASRIGNLPMINRQAMPAEIARSYFDASVGQTVNDAARRMGIGEEGRKIMSGLYSGNRENAIDYVGEMTKYYNQGKENKAFNVADTEGNQFSNAQQAQAAWMAGRADQLASTAREEISNDREEGLRVRTGSEWQNGQSASGSAGIVEEGTAAAQRGQAGPVQREGGNARVSSESLRQNASYAIASAGLKVVTNDSRLANAKKYAEGHGMNFVAWAGGALTIDGEQSRGYYDPETNTIYVRADHQLFTAEQLTIHETTHGRIRNGEIVLGRADGKEETASLKTVYKALVKELGIEKFEEMLDAYVEIYAGINISRQGVFEEMICDAMAGMNDFLSVGHFADALKYAASLETAKAVTEENAANGERAGPEENAHVGKYSGRAEALALKDVNWVGDHTSIWKQLIDNREALSNMAPIVEITYAGEDGINLENLIYEQLEKIGGGRISRGQVTFDFDKPGIKSVRAHAKSPELRAAAVAAPFVAKKGKLIAGQKNHEETNTTTLTYAGPVTFVSPDGKIRVPVNVGVVIQFVSNGRPHAISFDVDGGDSLKAFKKAASGPRGGLKKTQATYPLTPGSFSMDNVAEKGSPVKQNISSAGTSLNQVPALHKDPRIEWGDTNIDIGAGAYEAATEYLKAKGVTNLKWDPYNQSEAVNRSTLKYLQDGKKADTATCANVLNVIREKDARLNVILQAAKSIDSDGKAYFMVYEGDGSGKGKETSKGWQNNLKTREYADEIRAYFNDVQVKGKLIVASGVKTNLPKASWEVKPGTAIKYSRDTSAQGSFNNLFATLEDGRIKPNNVEDLSTEDWQLIYKVVKKLGYGIESAKQAKEVYSRYVGQGGFNKEQSEAIKKAYGVSDSNGIVANPKREALARKTFGTTGDFREAGYLMRNGSMLDFSGKKDGGPAHVRYMDHREIGSVFGEDEIPEEKRRYGDASAYMNAFISEGNIRLMDGQGVTIGEMEPTSQQYTILKQFINRTLKNEDYFYLDLSNNDGNTIESRDYSSDDGADRIIRDIKAYYKNGELPYRSELSKFYSREIDSYLQEQHKEYKDDEVNRRIAEEGVRDLIKGFERISASGGEVDMAKQGRDIRTLGNGISAQFVKSGRVNLNGTRIRSAEDLAQVGQIFRNPKFETIRYFYVKKGKIVGTDSVTAKLPGISPAFSEDFQEADLLKKIGRTGADGVYLLHNHPSGDVTPSRQDFGVTGKLAEAIQNNTKAKFMGHVVIDHETYAQIDVDTNKRTASWEQKTIPGQGSFDLLLTPSLENANLGKEVLSPGAVAAVGKDVVNGSGYSAIIYTSSKGYVRQLQEISDKVIKNNKQIGNYIRNQRVNAGAGMAFVYTKDRAVYDALVQVYGDDILTDVVLDGSEYKDMRKNVFQREGMYMGVKEGDISAVHANEGQADFNVTKFSRDLSNTELYEANRQLQKDLTELRSKLKTRTEQYKYWKGQTKVTEGRQLRIDDVTRLAREIVKGQESSADAKAVAEKMKALGEYILNTTDENVYDEARLKAYEIAHEILSNAKVLNEQGGEHFYKDFRTALKQTPIYVTPSVREEVSPDGWSGLRQMAKGIFTPTADKSKGKTVDVIYHDLQSTFGEWLLPEYITSEADQLNKIFEVVETYQPVYENVNSYDMADATEWTANEILTRIIGEEIRETNPTYADRMEKKLSDQKVKSQEAIRRVREQRDRKVQNLKEHYQQVAEDRRNRKIDSEMRTRLLHIAKRLNNKKLDRATRALLDQYIGEIDLVSKGILGRTIQELETLRDWYDDWCEQQKAELGEDFVPDTAIENRIKRLSKKRINDLTQEEVADLTTVLLNIEHQLRTQHEFIDSEERRDTYAAAMAFREDYQEGKSSTENAFARAILFGLSGKNKESGGDGLLTPERAMHRLGNYNDDDPGYKLGKELSAGQRKMLDYQMRANALFDAWLKDKEFIDSLAGKNANWITVKGLVKGELTDVRITPAMRMSLYLHAKNEQNLNHIERGGVLIPNEAKYKKGELNNAYKENYGTHATFSRYMIHEIAKGMSEKERAFADMAYWYFNNMSKDAINETSEMHKGYPIATVEKYFPIESSRDFLKADFGMLLPDGSVAGQGFLNERNVNSTNPIMLYDMNDVLTKSIAGHSRYYGLALPVQNLNKMMNVIMLGQEGSIRNMLLDEHVKYIDKMVRDVQTGAPGVGGLLSALRSNYAGGVLVLNGGVAVKQAASYPTAAAVLGYMPLVKALKDRNKKVDLNLIAKYTPLLWYRSKGYSTAELGDIGNRGGIASKVTNVKQLNWIQGVDVWTTTKLWTAAEYYVRDNNKALTYGTDAFYKAVAEVYNRVIEETQPNYTAMQRPGVLRSDNQLTRALNMFKTQPFQNANILIDAYGNMRAKARQNKANPTAENTKALKEARKTFARAVTSQALSAFTFALMQAIWDMARGKFKKYKDDDDEATFWSVNKQLLLNMVTSFGGMVPYGGTVLEFLESSVDDISKLLGGEAVFDQKFYGFSENSLEAANDLGNTTKSLLANVIKTFLGNQTGETSARNIVDGLSTLIHMSTGLPAPNVVKDMQVLGLNAWRFYERFNGGWDEKSRLMAEYASLRVTTDPAKYKSDYYTLLEKAWRHDEAAYAEIYNKMIGEKGFATESNSAKTNVDASIKKWGYVLLKDAWERDENEFESLRQKMLNLPGDPFATSKSSAENIDAKVKDWIKEKAQQSETKQAFYGTVYDEMTANSLWNKATDAAKDKALEKLLSLALEMGVEGSDKNGAKYKADIEGGKAVGIDATEYMLYQVALQMADADGNGTIKQSEAEAAVNMLSGLSNDEKAYLFQTTNKTWKNNPWK